DIQTGDAFMNAWQSLKTGRSRSANEATWRLTRDIQQIFGFDDFEMNVSPEQKTLQLFVNGRSYRLDEQGSGLAQFVVVLSNAATRHPNYVLIDEPEINLHPSLQLDFLTTIASYASEGVLFATHNLGLARAASERLYSLRREGQGASRIAEFASTPRLAEFLGELSFTSYREVA